MQTDTQKGYAEKSTLHQKSLEMIIQKAIDTGVVKPVSAKYAANCFWAVFVFNLSAYTKMIGCSLQDTEPEDVRKKADCVRNIAVFCFQGLGLDNGIWVKYLDQIIHEGGNCDEGI